MYLTPSSFILATRLYYYETLNQTSQLKLLSIFKAHKNANWTIRNALYLSKDQSTNDHSLLLATGSAEPFAYVHQYKKESGGEFIQKLDGHSDRVYGVDFKSQASFS